ncbi:TPA: hypothetical protein ACH3X3_009653 [Trebouxia sp. C0006]
MIGHRLLALSCFCSSSSGCGCITGTHSVALQCTRHVRILDCQTCETLLMLARLSQTVILSGVYSLYVRQLQALRLDMLSDSLEALREALTVKAKWFKWLN